MKLPENDNLVSKRVAIGTLLEVCFVIHVILHFTQYILLVNVLNVRKYMT